MAILKKEDVENEKEELLNKVANKIKENGLVKVNTHDLSFENLNCTVHIGEDTKLTEPLYFIDGKHPTMVNLPSPYDVPIENYYDFASMFGNMEDYEIDNSIMKAANIIADRANSAIASNYNALEYNYLIREVQEFIDPRFLSTISDYHKNLRYGIDSFNISYYYKIIFKHPELIGTYVLSLKMHSTHIIANNLSRMIRIIMDNINIDKAGIYFLQQCGIDPKEVKDRHMLYTFIEGCLQEIAKNINLKMNEIVEINVASAFIALKNMTDAMGEPIKKVNQKEDDADYRWEEDNF